MAISATQFLKVMALEQLYTTGGGPAETDLLLRKEGRNVLGIGNKRWNHQTQQNTHREREEKTDTLRARYDVQRMIEKWRGGSAGQFRLAPLLTLAQAA